MSNLSTETVMHLVMCSTGEYSDRCEYPLFVTTNEALAQEYVRRLEALLPPVVAAARTWRESWGLRRGTFDPNPEWEAYRAAQAHASEQVKAMVPMRDEYFSFDDDFRAWVVTLPVKESS